MRIAIAQGPDIVGNKVAASAEHPFDVATGLEELKPGVTDKRQRLLKQVGAEISRVAVPSPTPSESGHAGKQSGPRQRSA